MLPFFNLLRRNESMESPSERGSNTGAIQIGSRCQAHKGAGWRRRAGGAGGQGSVTSHLALSSVLAGNFPERVLENSFKCQRRGFTDTNASSDISNGTLYGVLHSKCSCDVPFHGGS